MKKISIIVISDASGDAAQMLVNIASAQFSDDQKVDLKRFPLVRDSDTLQGVLEDAAKDRSAVVTSFVQKALSQQTAAFCQEHDLSHRELLGPLVDQMAELTGETPAEKPEKLNQLNDQYYYRMNAINFASKYDDGKDPKGFLKADLVILGPSRTSKTPLSMYLANQSIRVANLPLIPEVQVPEELLQVPREKIVGLVADPDYIQKIRDSRLHSLGLTSGSSYSDVARIKKEMNYAHELMDELGVKVFDITNRSIEETAGLIMESLPELGA